MMYMHVYSHLVQIAAAGGALDVLRGLSSAISQMTSKLVSMATSISNLEAAIADQEETMDLRSGLNTSVAAVQAAGPALSAAQSALDGLTGNSQTQLDDAKALVKAYFLSFASAYAGALLVGVVAVLASLAPMKLCKPCYKVSLCFNLALLFFIWVVASLSILPAAGLSDFCISPGPARALVGVTHDLTPGEPASTLEYYVICADTRSAADPAFNPPGAYGSIVQFSRESAGATAQVLNISSEVRANSAVMGSSGVRVAVDDMDSKAAAVQASTIALADSASCSTVGASVFNPMFAALCQDISGRGIVQFWATHTAMGCILFFFQLLGVWFMHGARHPAESKQCVLFCGSTQSGPARGNTTMNPAASTEMTGLSSSA